MRRMTALVTGASRGIGRAIARQLSEDGFRIALHFNTNESAVETSLASLHGKDHLIMAADLSNPDGSSALAAGVLDEFDGRVDILVHNAGIYRRTPILGTASLAECRKAFADRCS